MTEGEIKFALQVESVLNHVPEPEYRQLIVEALITLTIFSELNKRKHIINSVIPVNDIVTTAYRIYLNDGVSSSSSATEYTAGHCSGCITPLFLIQTHSVYCKLRLIYHLVYSSRLHVIMLLWRCGIYVYCILGVNDIL